MSTEIDDRLAGIAARKQEVGYDAYMRDDRLRAEELALLEAKNGERADMPPRQSRVEHELEEIGRERRRDINAFMKNEPLRQRERELLERVAGDSDVPASRSDRGGVPLDAAKVAIDAPPPESPSDYEFEYTSQPNSGVEATWDLDVRQAFHDAAVPQDAASALYTSIDQTARRFEHASDADLQAHVDRVTAELRRNWGDGFEERVAAIKDVLSSVRGDVGDVLRKESWVLFGDVRTIELLDRLAQRRRRRE